MYSPKIIDESLIPELYRLGQEKGEPMTVIVDRFIRQGLAREKRRKPNKEGPEDECAE